MYVILLLVARKRYNKQTINKNMHTNKTAKTLESSFHLQNSADKLQYIMSNDDILFRQEQVQLVTKQMKRQ